MAKSKPSEIVGKIVDLLTPLSSDDRSRVIAASLTLLGETLPKGIKGGDREDGDASGGEGTSISASGKTRTWQKQNSISAEQLGQVFHSADGKTDIIASEMPGKNKKEKTLNAYVLTGIAQLLNGGEPKFSDKDARALCTSAGCYDSANHSSSLKDKGNWFTGTKEKGWTLTAPGLKHGATLVKNLTTETE